MNEANIPVLGTDTTERVCFYERDFYVFSNFSAFKVKWKGIWFDTSEAAYHWEKFPDQPYIQAAIRNAISAHDAFKLAEVNRAFRRSDWELTAGQGKLSYWGYFEFPCEECAKKANAEINHIHRGLTLLTSKNHKETIRSSSPSESKEE